MVLSISALTIISIYALDALTGKKLWKRETGTQVTSSPVISRGVVVIGRGDGYGYTLNAKNGKPRLQFETYIELFMRPRRSITAWPISLILPVIFTR